MPYLQNKRNIATDIIVIMDKSNENLMIFECNNCEGKW